MIRRLIGCGLLWVLLIAEAVSAAPLIVAHRGASKDAPENTIPAFKLAWDQGADAVEGDFLLTADGEIVCIHDKDTKRVAERNLMIKSALLKELLSLDVGLWRGERWTGTKIPMLSEVLGTIPNNKQIYIEIKCGSEIIPNLLEVLKKSGLCNEQIVVISFNTKVIYDIKTLAPNMKAVWLSRLKISKSGDLEPSIEEALTTLERIGADGISCSGHERLDEKYISRIQKEGYEFHVWTIDNSNDAIRFAGIGVQSITTNKPLEIREALMTKKVYE